MALLDQILYFFASLMIGGIGVYTGARIVIGKKDYGFAVLTALFAALVWSVTSSFFSNIPFIGPATVLLAWLGAIRWRYRTSWFDTLLISLLAWSASLIVLYLLQSAGMTNVSALGIPGRGL